jgi:hypothetical protein
LEGERKNGCGMAGMAEAVTAKRLACDSPGVLCIIFVSSS